MMRQSKLVVSILLLASCAFAQKVIEPWQVPCKEELVQPNLELKESHRFFGELKDATGEPLGNSKLLLRKQDAKGNFGSYRTVATEKDGRFDLGTVDPGKYRFLPGPNRGWKQPKDVKCWEGRDCEIKMVLQVNPSDQEFAGCPVQ